MGKDEVAHQAGQSRTGYPCFSDEGADTNDPPWTCYSSSRLPHLPQPKGVLIRPSRDC